MIAQIFQCPPDDFRIVFKKTERPITRTTQQGSHMAPPMTVINAKRLLLFADSTTTLLLLKHCLILIFGDAAVFESARQIDLFPIFGVPFQLIITSAGTTGPFERVSCCVPTKLVFIAELTAS
jgi:hypothetical protein